MGPFIRNWVSRLYRYVKSELSGWTSECRWLLLHWVSGMAAQGFGVLCVCILRLNKKKEIATTAWEFLNQSYFLGAVMNA